MKTRFAPLAIGLCLVAACSTPTPVTVVKEVIKEVPKEVTVTKEVVREVPATVIVVPTATARPAPVELSLWHPFAPGSLDESALNNALAFMVQLKPETKISAKYVPFDQIYRKFETDVAAGNGPDLLFAPDDELGNQVRAKLLAPLDDVLPNKLEGYTDLARRAVLIEGKTYGVPASIKTVALFYNTERVKTAPRSTDELLAMVKGGSKLAVLPNCYHNFGFYAAFDGAIFNKDLSTARDKAEGVTAAFAYLKELKTAAGAASFFDDGAKADLAFREERVDMIVNGPWVLPDYQRALGAKLAAVPMPGNRNPASPMAGVDAFYVSAGSKKAKAAADAALFLTNRDNQRLFADVAAWIPARNDVDVTSPAMKGLSQAAATSVVRPQTRELNGYWSNFCGTYDDVLKKGDDPKVAVARAFEGMLKTNGR